MITWASLVKTALLGTRRSQLDMTGNGSPLDPLLAKLRADDPEHQLLGAAGAAMTYQQIGSSPQIYAKAGGLRFHDPDPRPICGPATANLLASLLSGPQRGQMPECLQAIQHQGQRLPPSLVPNSLALGFKTPALRPLIIPLLGPGDRHLAAQHSDWLYASPAYDSWNGAWQIWQELSQMSKTRFMQQLRVTNPQLGRQLLESSWKAENNAARMTLIKQLETGLGKNDEPFLEMALDDRSYNVRRVAAELLAAVPGSRLSQRMIVHAQSFLSWTGSGIHIRFPQVTPAMIRDGVHGMQSKKIAHVRSKQLIQIVGAVPLSFWTTHWHSDPGLIMGSAMKTNWKRTLTSGFAEAASRQKNSEWARAILYGRGQGVLPIKLLDVLTQTDFGQWLDYLLLDEGQPDLDFRSPLLKSIRHRTELNDIQSLQLLEIISGYMAAETDNKHANATEKRAFETLATKCPVTILPEAERILGKGRNFARIWQPTAVKMLNTLRFRNSMLEKVMKGE